MKFEAIGTGANIDEAIAAAVKELNAPAGADVHTEVLAYPTKKILGLFGGSPAKAKAYYELPDEPKKAQAPKKTAPKAEKKQPAAPKAPATAPVKAEVKEEPAAAETVKTAVNIQDSASLKCAAEYLTEILTGMGVSDVKIEAYRVQDNEVILELDCGDDYGIVIGRRGETLDSLQYLAGLAANNGGGYYKVSLNIGDYRQRREETLINLAGRICKQVIETGKCRTLEPMNPYERRIIHTAVQNFDGVTSASFGEGADRRVVIGIEGTELKPLRQNKGRRDDRRDNRRHRSNRSNNNTAASAPAREPKKDSDIPLYGKIN